MNATLYRTTDVEVELSNLTAMDEGYETAPMLAIVPLPQLPDEEELHLQFEEALCERAAAFGSGLNCLSDSAWYAEVSSIALSSAPLTTPTTEPLSEMTVAEISTAHTEQIDGLQMPAKKQRSRSFLNLHIQRTLIYCCVAFSCMLLGFDMMGLLVLHMH